MAKLKLKDFVTKIFAQKNSKPSKLDKQENNINHINAEAPPRV